MRSLCRPATIYAETPGRHRRLHAFGVFTLGEHDDRAALVARGDDDVFEHVARVGLGVDDDHVGLQLSNTLRQIHIGRQRSDDVVARFQQTDTQGASPLGLRVQGLVTFVFGVDDGIDDNDAQITHGWPGA
jgi:hypothetical protein